MRTYEIFSRNPFRMRSYKKHRGWGRGPQPSNSHPLFLPSIPFFLKLLRTPSPFSYATAQNNLFGIKRFHTLCRRNRGVSARLLAHSALREERCVLLTIRRSVQCLCGKSLSTAHSTRNTGHEPLRSSLS